MAENSKQLQSCDSNNTVQKSGVRKNFF